MDKSHYLGSDFTTDAIAILDQLEPRAAARGINLSISLPDLLLWTILRWEPKVGVAALELMGINCWDLQKYLDLFLKTKSNCHSINHPISAVKDWANREAYLMGNNYKGTEHLLLGALSAADAELCCFLSENHLEYEKVKAAVMKALLPGLKGDIHHSS